MTNPSQRPQEINFVICRISSNFKFITRKHPFGMVFAIGNHLLQQSKNHANPSGQGIGTIQSCLLLTSIFQQA